MKLNSALNSRFIRPIVLATVIAPPWKKFKLYDFYNHTFESVLADTDELRQECFKLRYQVYCVENDWERKSNPFAAEEIERDIYDDHSVHALLRHRPTGLFIGTVRLILQPPHASGARLPIHDLCEANNIHIPELVPPHQFAEISRLCITKTFRRRVRDTIQGIGESSNQSAADRARIIPAMSLGLMSMIVLMAKMNGLKHLSCEMEPFLIDLLGRLGMDIKPVGPTIDFHGKRHICHSLIDTMLDRIKEKQPEIWDIITNKGQHCVPLRLQKPLKAHNKTSCSASNR